MTSPHPGVQTRITWSVAVTAVLVLAVGTGVYLAASWFFAPGGKMFDAARPDFFYLADAFLHGRTWLEKQLGPWDIVVIDGHAFVPFAPGPAFVLLPFVAAIGPTVAATWEALVNALLAGVGVALCWVLAARLGVTRTTDRIWVVVLFGFGTATWWITTRGGVWHTAQLIASILTLLGLIESFGKRRPLLLGLLAGAAFLCRAPLVFALPFWAWVVWPRQGETGWDGGRHPSVLRRWIVLAVGFLPAGLFALWYNQVRFGSPLESGYALAALPAFLEAQRAKGLFSLAHVGMNIDYLFLKLPTFTADFPFIKPDWLGMSVLFTSPGLLLAVRADWRQRASWALLGAAALVVVPSLLYYGGGWLQFGYRYFLDSIPFVMALVCLAAARVGVGWVWRALIAFSVAVNLASVYWAYHS